MKCPACGREIKALKLHVVIEREMFVKWLTENGFEELEKPITIREKEKGRYYLCPYCDALITDSDEIAKKIVRGEEIDY